MGTWKVLVGLGNPGPKYAKTRHNTGFMVIDRVAAHLSVHLKPWRRLALVAESEIDGVPLVLAKPMTYMNRSGEAVKPLLEAYGAGPEDLVVVYDDIDLEQGTLRIRPSGGSGGHRGVASIIEALGTEEFGRIRVGLGRPPLKDFDAAEFVLQNFGLIELQILNPAMQRAVLAVRTIFTEGYEAAMNRYNG